MHYALDLLRRTLGLHTAVLLWLNDSGTHFRISELATESDDIEEAAPIAAGDGVLGAVVARRDRLNLMNLGPRTRCRTTQGPARSARSRRSGHGRRHPPRRPRDRCPASEAFTPRRKASSSRRALLPRAIR
ncbi:MAG: hypothetical protein U0235_16085 [Polyangiaceae bacterium]